MKTVSFTEMKHGTKQDYDYLEVLEQPYREGTAKRILKALAAQGEESLAGYKVSRLEHALQSATLTNAMLLGVGGELGQLKEGFIADIIAVDENPLTNISALKHVTFVMKEGKVYKN